MLAGFIAAIVWHQLYTVMLEPKTHVHIYNLPLAFFVALFINGVVSLAWPDARAGRLPDAAAD